MTDSEPAAVRWCVLGRCADGRVAVVEVRTDGSRGETHSVDQAELSAFVSGREESSAPRWVWSDTPTWYPALLAAGVRIARCTDLRLSHAILRNAAAVQHANELRAANEWNVASAVPDPEPNGPALFELERNTTLSVPHGAEDALAEFARQREALASAIEPARLGLLLAAESAGALAAVEMSAAGVPWDVAEHDRLLREVLGSRPASGTKPERMIEVAEEVRAALGTPRPVLIRRRSCFVR
ncbi:hypothetical protein [Leucobacter coleopterorum]|uniref:hypothetical protein n=1 Tax=Leucobacter coleopterorum TaxID=2714933 RepID=UPI003137EECF